MSDIDSPPATYASPRARPAGSSVRPWMFSVGDSVLFQPRKGQAWRRGLIQKVTHKIRGAQFKIAEWSKPQTVHSKIRARRMAPFVADQTRRQRAIAIGNAANQGRRRMFTPENVEEQRQADRIRRIERATELARMPSPGARSVKRRPATTGKKKTKKQKTKQGYASGPKSRSKRRSALARKLKTTRKKRARQGVRKTRRHRRKKIGGNQWDAPLPDSRHARDQGMARTRSIKRHSTLHDRRSRPKGWQIALTEAEMADAPAYSTPADVWKDVSMPTAPAQYTPTATAPPRKDNWTVRARQRTARSKQQAQSQQLTRSRQPPRSGQSTEAFRKEYAYGGEVSWPNALQLYFQNMFLGRIGRMGSAWNESMRKVRELAEGEGAYDSDDKFLKRAEIGEAVFGKGWQQRKDEIADEHAARSRNL